MKRLELLLRRQRMKAGEKRIDQCESVGSEAARQWGTVC